MLWDFSDEISHAVEVLVRRLRESAMNLEAPDLYRVLAALLVRYTVEAGVSLDHPDGAPSHHSSDRVEVSFLKVTSTGIARFEFL